jgi:ABC-type phosphate transport system substrate-binding protein
MSTIVAHRPHARAPWSALVVVLAIVAAVGLVALLAFGSPQTTPVTTGTQAVSLAGAGGDTALAPAATAGLPRYARAPWATDGSSVTTPFAVPPLAKYCRAPWATGGAGSSDR